MNRWLWLVLLYYESRAAVVSCRSVNIASRLDVVRIHIILDEGDHDVVALFDHRNVCKYTETELRSLPAL